MRSLSDLNNKWWYRLIKVIFCGLFLILGIGSAVWVYAANRIVLEPDWEITCDYGNHSTFNAQHDKGISISDYDPDKAVPDAMNAQIIQACGITQADINAAQAKANAEASAIGEKQGVPGWFMGLPLTLNISAVTYGISPTEVPVSNSGKAIAYATLDIIITLCLFEILRRAFYYIATGRIRPPNK